MNLNWQSAKGLPLGESQRSQDKTMTQLTRNWWAFGIRGGAAIAFGIVAFVRPDITALGLLLVIAYWAILVGVSQVVAAYRMRRVISREWLLAANGVLTAAFGIYVLLFPGAGALALIWWIGWYAILSGAMLLAIAARLRRSSKTQDAGSIGLATTR